MGCFYDLWTRQTQPIKTRCDPVNFDFEWLDGHSFFVHKSPEKRPKPESKWVVTHEGTGAAAGRGSTKKNAIHMAEKNLETAGKSGFAKALRKVKRIQDGTE